MSNFRGDQFPIAVADEQGCTGFGMPRGITTSAFSITDGLQKQEARSGVGMATLPCEVVVQEIKLSKMSSRITVKTILSQEAGEFFHR